MEATAENFMLLALAAGAAFAIGRTIYEAGYRRGQEALLRPLRPASEDEQNMALMKLTLPLWRRVAGRAAVILAGLSWFCWMYFASQIGSAWAFVAASAGALATLMGGFVILERLWKPFREAQARARKSRQDAVKSGEGTR